MKPEFNFELMTEILEQAKGRQFPWLHDGDVDMTDEAQMEEYEEMYERITTWYREKEALELEQRTRDKDDGT